MGFFDWLLGESKSYRRHACVWLDEVHSKAERAFEGGSKEWFEYVTKHLRAEISAINMQGGKRAHKKAVALWQIYHAIYPEYITKEDYPKRVKEYWHDADPVNPPEMP